MTSNFTFKKLAVVVVMETLHHVHYATLLGMLRRTAMSMKLSNHTVKIPLHIDESSAYGTVL